MESQVNRKKPARGDQELDAVPYEPNAVFPEE